jgi:hypothetical protein
LRPERKTRPYTRKNAIKVLRILSESPDKYFIIAYILRKIKHESWDRLKNCLDDLVGLNCVEYIPKEESMVGHDTYRITQLGRTVLSYWDSKDPIAKIIRELLGV